MYIFHFFSWFEATLHVAQRKLRKSGREGVAIDIEINIEIDIEIEREREREGASWAASLGPDV